MATSEGAGETKPASRTTARRSGSTRTSARRSASPRATPARGTARATPAHRGRSGPVGLAERAMLVQVGAGLRAQESLVSTVKGIASRYGTRASVLRELDRCETRGATVRKGMERQFHLSRSQLERQVRAMRHDFEREARAVRRDLGRRSAGAQKLARKAQERVTALT